MESESLKIIAHIGDQVSTTSEKIGMQSTSHLWTRQCLIIGAGEVLLIIIIGFARCEDINYYLIVLYRVCLKCKYVYDSYPFVIRFQMFRKWMGFLCLGFYCCSDAIKCILTPDLFKAAVRTDFDDVFISGILPVSVYCRGMLPVD